MQRLKIESITNLERESDHERLENSTERKRLEDRVGALEQRVTALEGVINGSFRTFSREKCTQISQHQTDEVIGKKLEGWLEERNLLKPLLAAGSVDGIEDPIMYRLVLESIYQFTLKERIILPE